MDAVKFTIGQIVFQKINPEVSGMVTGILFRPACICYCVKWADESAEVYHYDIELTSEKTFAPAET